METPPIPIGLQTPPTPRFGPKHDPPVRRKDEGKHDLDTVGHDGGETKEKEASNAAAEADLRKLNQHTLSRLGLPTPAKTPSKKRRAVEPGATASSAKLLFGDEIRRKPTSAVRAAVASEVDPFGFAEPTLPSRRNKLEVFSNEHDFEIYTDSNLRTPEMDDSADNPFVDHDEDISPEKAKKLREARIKSEKRFAKLGGNREDGAVYTFRGKKFFKKFDEDRPHQHVKPRLLFPSAAQLRERQKREEDDALDLEPSPPPGIRENSPPLDASPRSNGSVVECGRISKSKVETPKTPRVTRSSARESAAVTPGPERRVTRQTPATPKTPAKAPEPKTPVKAVPVTPRTPPRRTAKRKATESLSPEKGIYSPRKKRALRG